MKKMKNKRLMTHKTEGLWTGWRGFFCFVFYSETVPYPDKERILKITHRIVFNQLKPEIYISVQDQNKTILNLREIEWIQMDGFQSKIFHWDKVLKYLLLFASIVSMGEQPHSDACILEMLFIQLKQLNLRPLTSHFCTLSEIKLS